MLKAVDALISTQARETLGSSVRVDVANRQRRDWSHGCSNRTAGSAYLQGTISSHYRCRGSKRGKRTVCLPRPLQLAHPRKTIMQILSRPLEVHDLAHSFLQKRQRVSSC